MDADLISLELKISKLIDFCAALRNENSGLRDDLMVSHQNAQALQTKMLQASNQLEHLLHLIPNGVASENVSFQNTKSL